MEAHLAETNGVSGFCLSDPLNWGSVARSLSGSHLDEVRRMVEEFRKRVVQLGGEKLMVAQVAAVTAAGGARVVLDESAQAGMEASSNWVTESMEKGTDSYGITTGFGVSSHRRNNHGAALQKELIV